MKKSHSQTVICLLAICMVLITPFGSEKALALDSQTGLKDYPHKVWQAQDGLPQNSVSAIVQTRDGYLWLGTREGLVRFDGVKFTLFNSTNTPAIRHNLITALLESQDNTLWIGTYGGGLSLLKDGEFSTYTSKDFLSNTKIASLYEDRSNVLWIGTDGGGLHRLVAGNDRNYTVKSGLPSDSIRSIFEDSSGSIWLATQNGLSRLKGEEFTNYTTEQGLSNNLVRSICDDHQGGLWVGTAGGLNHFKDQRFITYANTQDTSSIRSLYVDRGGSLWVGTDGGLKLYRDGSFQTYVAEGAARISSVYSIYEDHEGSIWIGSGADGLHRFINSKFRIYSSVDGLSDNKVSAIRQTKDGSIWIGTATGLNQFKNGKFTTYSTRDGLPGKPIDSIYEDHTGVLWIGTYGGGLSRFREGKFFNYTTGNGLSDNFVTSIYEDHKGSLWIGTYDGGLNRLTDGTFSTYTTAEGLSSNFIRSLLEDDQNNLWIGTYGGGLCRFRDDKFTVYTTKNGLSSDLISSLYLDQEGNLWIGTSGGGLNRLRNDSFVAYTAQDGLFDNTASSILEDQKGNLWMNSNKGIFHVSKNQLEAFSKGQIGQITSVSYGTPEGLGNSESRGKGWRTSDGKLWFPTTNGVLVFDPEQENLNSLPPPISIEQLIVNRVGASPRQSEFPADSRDFEFHYTALSFVAPEKVKFKYQLEGFDKGWVDAGTRREAYYTNLPPRKYSFRVIACNNDGVWNETGATFGFYVQPHFYQTKWFYALCALAITLSVFSIYRFRVRQLRRRTQELEVIVDQRTVELKREQQKVLKLEKQATEQQMAGGFAHEMRNALAGSKVLLDQALALDGPEPHVSLSLANCRSLKRIYLDSKDNLDAEKSRAMLAEMQVVFTNEERLNDVLQLVHKATSRGLNITQQIMQYSKFGQQQAGQETVDLNNLISTVISESREEFLIQGVGLEYKSANQSLCITGDETHFYGLVKNLVLNARDALIDPAVKDNVDRRIEVITAREGDSCTLVIVDNGIGIQPENLAKIFEPFFSTKPATGTGLGLGMVQKVVSLYNGSLNVSSEVGKGTRFTILLPLSWQDDTSSQLVDSSNGTTVHTPSNGLPT